MLPEAQNANNPACPRILDLGLQPYRNVWETQKSLQQKLIDGSDDEVIIFCQHHSVITMGRRANLENVIANPDQLRDQQIEIVEVERGGDVTWHGPGQLVCYPILDLKKRKRDVDWYMRSLEEVIIDTLENFSIPAQRIKDKTGVWTSDPDSSSVRKIASLGVRISRWCTMHGLALNINNSQSGFALIYPCGFKKIEMTSLEAERKRQKLKTPIDISRVQEVLTEKLLAFFSL